MIIGRYTSGAAGRVDRALSDAKPGRLRAPPCQQDSRGNPDNCGEAKQCSANEQPTTVSSLLLV